MRAGMIDMESNTTLVQCYPAHEAIPDGHGPFPPVLVLHDGFGLTDFVVATTNRLAKEGLYALAPDFFASPMSFVSVAPAQMRRSTGGPIPYTDHEAALTREDRLSDEHALNIFGHALGFLTIRSAARAGGAAVIGFGSGGRLALLAASRYQNEVRACVAYAPTDATPPAPRGRAVFDELAGIRCPLLLFYGGLDNRPRRAEREALVGELNRVGAHPDVKVFREAEHLFYVPGRDSFDISAARTAWDAAAKLIHARA